MSSETVYLLLPEAILILAATAIYVAGAFFPGRQDWPRFAAIGLLLAGLALAQQDSSESVRAALADTGTGIWSGPLVIDLFSHAVRWAVLAVGLGLVSMSARFIAPNMNAEYVGSLLLMIAGLMLLAVAGDLVLIFVALELVSIPTYVVLYLERGGPSTQESTTKYFFLSILSSALLLYGFSFLYGVSGSTRVDLIFQKLLATSSDAPGLALLAKVAMVLLFAGLGFRITLVPFHFYAPDVYQGTSNPNAGILAVVPKIAGLVVLVRLVAIAMVGNEGYLRDLAGVGWHLALALSLVTMTLGNLAALWQQNIRRLLAYSSIAHGGYMLIGLAVSLAVSGGAHGTENFDGVGATLFYLLVYGVATLGGFAVLTYLGAPDRQIENVDDLAGLSQSHPVMAAALAIFMFSLTGLPPFAGFWGKLALFMGAVGVDSVGQSAQDGLWPWFIALAVAGGINAAISAGYYLRMVAAMYFRTSLAVPPARGGFGAAITATVCMLLVAAMGFFPGRWMQSAKIASQAARTTIVRAAAGAAPPAQQASVPESGAKVVAIPHGNP